MKLNRTTLRTVDILKMVSKKPDGITLDEICEKLNFQRPAPMTLSQHWHIQVWSMW